MNTEMISSAYGVYTDRTSGTSERRSAKAEAQPEAAQARAGAENGFARVAGPIEDLMRSVGVELKFNIREETGEVQVEVMDSEGEKVIRKLPPDEQLKLAASIKELSTLFLNRSL